LKEKGQALFLLDPASPIQIANTWADIPKLDNTPIHTLDQYVMLHTRRNIKPKFNSYNRESSFKS